MLEQKVTEYLGDKSPSKSSLQRLLCAHCIRVTARSNQEPAGQAEGRDAEQADRPHFTHPSHTHPGRATHARSTGTRGRGAQGQAHERCVVWCAGAA